jgi:glycosyltransferase involved in cell wall biosynthesis
MSRPTLGVVLSQFPRYDEAFILRELVQLAEGPWTLRIFSLRPCHDRVVHAQAKALAPNTVYAPFLSAQVWRANLHFLRTRGAAYRAALGWVVSRHWAHPIALAKALALFPKTVYFAAVAEREGIRHLHAFWATYPATSAIVMSRLAGATYSLSGHAHDLYTANPALAEKIRGARFMLTCTEANRDYLLKLIGAVHSPQSMDHSKAVDSRQSTVHGKNGRPAVDRGPSTMDRGLSTTPEILVSYHGVDLSRFAATAKPDDGICRLLAVGSLLPCKGLETLIDACALLRVRRVPFQCTIAGGGPLERRLRRMIARHRLTDQITITGFVSQEQVAALYQQATVFALPLVSKIHWGIPNVLIEALATKTPVVSCALPSLAELVVHEHSGLIIPEHAPAALSDAIVRLWGDRPLRERLAEAGYARVIERFALDRTGRALRDVFGAHVS